jgi:hypothetical protein
LNQKVATFFRDLFRNKPSLLAIALVGIVAIWNATNYNYWKKQLIVSQDVIQYYSYLPAAFIENDIQLNFLDDTTFHLQPNQYWHLNTENGKRVFKYTCGEAVLISPFFLTANVFVSFSKQSSDGFGPTYQLGIVFAAVFYLMLGLFFLRKILLLYFNEKVTTASLLLITLATNLYYYATVESGMSHIYSFAIISVFLYYTFLFHESFRWRHACLVGLSFGLLVLIRPSNAVFILIFLGFHIQSWQSLIHKFELLKHQFGKLLLIAALAFAVFFIQMMYWKVNTGHWLFYSYMKERFYFENPHIIETLIGFRKGLLVYCPVLLFAFVGIFMSLKKHPEFGFPFLLFLLVNIYVVSSWWCWWYGGSYGLRAYIDMYPVLAVGLAFFIQYILKLPKMVQSISKVFALALVMLTCIQIYQYRKGILHYDGMTQRAYFNIFLQFKTPDNHTETLNPPDYDKAVMNEEE